MPVLPAVPSPTRVLSLKLTFTTFASTMTPKAAAHSGALLAIQRSDVIAEHQRGMDILLGLRAFEADSAPHVPFVGNDNVSGPICPHGVSRSTVTKIGVEPSNCGVTSRQPPASFCWRLFAVDKVHWVLSIEAKSR
jgi:hypothetical protein